MKNKEVNCKNCAKPIDKKAVVCPHCGVKVKKPFYKKAWFIFAVIIILIAVVASSGKDEGSVQTDNAIAEQKASEAVERTYTEYSVSQLVKDLESNALKAENTYNNQYVKLTGKLSNIDSDGKYISLSPSDNSFTLISVQCYLKNDEQKQKVAEMSVGDEIVVKGKIKDIGELLGYQLDVDSFE